MSDLKKMKVVIKNYEAQGLGDLDALYGRVRLEDEQGNTFYFEKVVMLKYLQRHGAMSTDVPRVWYFKHLSKKSIVVLAFEKNGGQVEYDLDDLRVITRTAVLRGVLMTLAAVPMGVIAATATFGLGFVLIPMGLWYGYKNVFKLPKMLGRKTLLSDFAKAGVVVR